MSNNAVDTEIAGQPVEVSDRLKPTKESRYAIKDARQAQAVAAALKQKHEQLIKNAATITAFLNFKPPRIPADLEKYGRAQISNYATGWLRKECSRLPGRFSQPILTASSLTAAELPSGTPKGAEKSQIFRQALTDLVRGWSDWLWFLKLLFREASYFGYGFAVFFDEFEWRPTFIRQDKGFIPPGTKIMGGGPAIFVVDYDYRVHELLEVVDQSIAKGRGDYWTLKNVARAINAAATVATDGSALNARTFEEMRRDLTAGSSYENASRVVRTQHIFSTDPDGRVSHHLVVRAEAPPAPTGGQSDAKDDGLLFEKRSQFESMRDVVLPIVFDSESGTIHGSWGAGQMLFKLALEFDLSHNDWATSMRRASRMNVQAGAGVDPDEVKLRIDEEVNVVAFGTFAGNTAALHTDPAPFQALQQSYDKLARENIQDYLPPIELTPGDIKAHQVNEAVDEQQKLREQRLHELLLQFSWLMQAMVKRATAKGVRDPAAKALRAFLLTQMSEEEIKLLSGQPAQKTIEDFTTYAASKRAAFCAAKAGNAFYDQKRLERVQAEAIGGTQFADSVMIAGDDTTVDDRARREQQLETAAMKAGEIVQVLPEDLDYPHMLALRPEVVLAFEAGNLPLAGVMLSHLAQHFVACLNKKGFPKGESGNNFKAFIQKCIDVLKTEKLPAQGFEDDPDLMGQVEQAMHGPQQPAGA